MTRAEKRTVWTLAHWIWAVLAGVKLTRALERHQRAASKLDTAVREVLGYETGDLAHHTDRHRT